MAGLLDTMRAKLAPEPAAEREARLWRVARAVADAEASGDVPEALAGELDRLPHAERVEVAERAKRVRRVRERVSEAREVDARHAALREAEAAAERHRVELEARIAELKRVAWARPVKAAAEALTRARQAESELRRALPADLLARVEAAEERARGAVASRNYARRMLDGGREALLASLRDDVKRLEHDRLSTPEGSQMSLDYWHRSCDERIAKKNASIAAVPPVKALRAQLVQADEDEAAAAAELEAAWTAVAAL